MTEKELRIWMSSDEAPKLICDENDVWEIQDKNTTYIMSQREIFKEFGFYLHKNGQWSKPKFTRSTEVKIDVDYNFIE